MKRDCHAERRAGRRPNPPARPAVGSSFRKAVPLPTSASA